MSSKQEFCNWSESAFYWAKHRKSIEQLYKPVTEAMIRLGEIDTCSTILDIAGGTGEPSLTIAESDPKPKITVTDLELEMIKLAKEESHRRRLKHLTFCRCNGERLPFANENFEGVVSRFGIMFFPDPARGLREMLRVTRPGGRVVLAAWHQEEANPMFYLTNEILKRYVPQDTERKEHEDPFRFAFPGKLTALAKEAGGENIKEEIVEFLAQAPLTLEEFWALRSEMSEKIRVKLRLLTSEQHQSLKNDIQKALRPYFTATHMSFPATAILMTCAR